MELAFLKTTDDMMMLGELAGKSDSYVALRNPLRYDGEGECWRLDGEMLDVCSCESNVITFFAHVISRWGKVTDGFWRKQYDEQIDYFREQSNV